ncbi:MAG: ABC transporter substrate-binding protein [Rhodoferax sp.]|nr:ABC transporter substrate-binding protein [Rhodoferax sp.]
MNRRDFLTALSLLGLPVLASGCRHPVAPMRIACHVWPGYEFLFLAQREGWIAPADTVLVETGAATESLQALATAQVDGAALTLDEVLRARDQGLPLRVVLVFDVSVGADALLAKPGIDSLAQLKGRRIGYEQSALGALMLYKVLEAAELRPGDVKPVPVTFDRHLEIWITGGVDALITFEPAVGQLLERDGHRLFDSSRIPDTIFDVLAVMPKVVSDHPDALRRVVAAHFRGLDRFRRNPNDVAYHLADRFNQKPQEVLASFKGLELPNQSRNRKLLVGTDGILAGKARELATIMTQAGIRGSTPLDLSNLTDAAFISDEDVR